MPWGRSRSRPFWPAGGLGGEGPAAGAVAQFHTCIIYHPCNTRGVLGYGSGERGAANVCFVHISTASTVSVTHAQSVCITQYHTFSNPSPDSPHELPPARYSTLMAPVVLVLEKHLRANAAVEPETPAERTFLDVVVPRLQSALVAFKSPDPDTTDFSRPQVAYSTPGAVSQLTLHSTVFNAKHMLLCKVRAVTSTWCCGECRCAGSLLSRCSTSSHEACVASTLTCARWHLPWRPWRIQLCPCLALIPTRTLMLHQAITRPTTTVITTCIRRSSEARATGSWHTHCCQVRAGCWNIAIDNSDATLFRNWYFSTVFLPPYSYHVS